MRYRLLTGTHSRSVNGEWTRFNAGDTLHLTPEDAVQFTRGRLEVLDAEVSAPAAKIPTDDLTRFVDVLGQNVSDVRADVDKIDDQKELELLIAAERAAGDRKGVVEYAAARITELTKES